MADNHYTVEQLLELAHKFKATHIKVGPLEIELSASAFGDAAESGTQANPDAEKVPTEQEFLFMAGLQLETPQGHQ